MTKQTTTTKKTTKTDRHVHATSSRPSISIAFNVHDTCENEKKKQSWFCRYSIASYPLFVLPLPTRLRVEHGHALRPLCIREVRWSGRCGMGTPFELVRNLADWGFNYRSFWCCFAPCTGGVDINIQQFLLAVRKNNRSEILHTTVLALELCTYWYT